VKCATVAEEDDAFCVKCGKRLPESPFDGEEPEPSRPAPAKPAAPEPPPAPPKTEKPAPEPEPPKPAPPKAELPPAPEKSYSLASGKDLMEFYDEFSYKTGFVMEDEVPIINTNFTLRAYQSKIIIWDGNRNGIKLEGFHKDGKRVSSFVNIQKDGANDSRYGAMGKDEAIANELNAIFSYMQQNNPKLITAVEVCREKYC
jgi:hypothetical protein